MKRIGGCAQSPSCMKILNIIIILYFYSFLLVFIVACLQRQVLGEATLPGRRELRALNLFCEFQRRTGGKHIAEGAFVLRIRKSFKQASSLSHPICLYV